MAGKLNWDVTSTYDSFLLSHAPRIASIESTLRSLTWFLPGRFQDAEVASEGVYATLNLVSSYHDSILVKLTESLPYSQRPAVSSHRRYVMYWMENSKPYRFASRSLVTIQYLQLLIEMVSKRKFGSEKRWRVVLIIEVVKAALRLAIVRITQLRPVIYPPVPAREFDPSQLQQKQEQEQQQQKQHGGTPSPQSSPASSFMADSQHLNGNGTNMESSDATFIHNNNNNNNGSLGPESWRGSRTGRERPTIASLRHSYSPRSSSPTSSTADSQNHHHNQNPRDTHEEINGFLLSRVLSVEDVKKPLDLVRPLDINGAQMAELIWVLRPVLYVIAIRKYGHHHMYPFLLSVVLEATWSHLQSSCSLPSHFMSDLERKQLAKRHSSMWWYMLRGPIWKNWTKVQLETIITSIESKPLVGIAGSFLREYLPLIEDLYYYTST